MPGVLEARTAGSGLCAQPQQTVVVGGGRVRVSRAEGWMRESMAGGWMRGIRATGWLRVIRAG